MTDLPSDAPPSPGPDWIDRLAAGWKAYIIIGFFALAAVLPGVTIGEGAVIGAGSVVNRSVPAYEMWAGAPARKIGVRK